jgi:hypothetical protein
VTLAAADELVAYLADLVERLDRFAVTLLPPNDGPEIELGQEDDGSLVIDLEGRLPVARRSPDVELDLFERWAPAGRDTFERTAYRFELRNRDLGYRRAFHRHDVDHFVRSFDVATHEHCEASIGVSICSHYHGPPAVDAFDAFNRLYDLWLMDAAPDCTALRCLA